MGKQVPVTAIELNALLENVKIIRRLVNLSIQTKSDFAKIESEINK